MDFRTAIEHLRNAGLDVDADYFIAYRNRAQYTASELRAHLAEAETHASEMSKHLAEVDRRLGMIREQPTAPADT